MGQANLAVDPYVISGIEWTLDTKFHFGIEQSKYLQEKIELDQFLPIKGANIPFGEDVWDFNECFKYRSGMAFRFSFKEIPKGFRASSKYFVLMTMLNSDNKITTIHRRFQDLKSFFKEMHQRGVRKPEHISTKDVREYMDNYIANHSYQSASMVRIALLLYIQFLKVNFSYDNGVDLKIFDSYLWLASERKKAGNAKKTPDIPKEYYNKLLTVLIGVMSDENTTYLERATACIYIILSQTGLRITEIHALTKTSLNEISVGDIDKAYCLEVKEFKPASKTEEYLSFRTFANELTVEAFQKLCEISDGRMQERETDFIFLPDVKVLPAASYSSLIAFKKILLRYAPFAVVSENEPSPYEGIEVTKAVISNTNYGYVAAPTTKQFRVHVCTELYYTHHVSLIFIQKCMGHLSEEMQGYYVRPKKKTNSEAMINEKLLKDIIENKVTLLGGKGSEITNQINQFIEEKNFEIMKNLDEVIDYINGKVAIRAKRNGFCVKATEYRECSRDAKTNEIYCAYDVCPNLCHVYYMADDSYNDFKTLQITFNENVKNGFDLQASRELKKLKAVCRQRLVPEMEDMKKKIHLRGVQAVLMDYPQLKEVIDRYDEIMEEIDSWKMKNY